MRFLERRMREPKKSEKELDGPSGGRRLPICSTPNPARTIQQKDINVWQRSTKWEAQNMTPEKFFQRLVN